ncbi:hypothetical protein LB565_15090 [Mesorhizobium sp. CA14]|uniref:hypothetical protein n=1 Tax=Mesorhizobium sp. CA14 TaxID=2876642 RepID=UPI001CCEDB3C|nr:hypothetical protein [Mesorhizobium sp. CA14]MBZ9849310.1 hypothetical protein [Mesorhizobium sp. CA14]
MTAFRLSTIGFLASALASALFAAAGVGAMAAPASATPAATANATLAQNLYKLCRQMKNDDTVRPYSHELYGGTVKAFKKLFPDAKDTPAESELQTQANYRCMNGKVLACFVGANLPCAKMNAARDNPGADEFCKTNPNDDAVPAFATGHDAVYAYKCRNGKAVVTGESWVLDKRGFAKKLWAVVPER